MLRSLKGSPRLGLALRKRVRSIRLAVRNIALRRGIYQSLVSKAYPTILHPSGSHLARKQAFDVKKDVATSPVTLGGIAPYFSGEQSKQQGHRFRRHHRRRRD